ncbi:uncharacterized protein LOC142598221 [Dermatophagoides farinae]|uniref:Uncharacterized protein n=1 Tax=Dermatophagoides farinae TaxID=6954 RepID=A0A922KVH7_DERFA|nr:hypothetical protein HUG17_1072 [Dermatophagoides farinae]KAH9497596.1 hypothetical protein DERF_013572 [Dermatophagoides farinae]
MSQSKQNSSGNDGNTDDSTMIKSSSSSLSKMTPEEAIEYLGQKYADRFTMNDPLFVESLDRQISVPPIEINYIGRIKRYRNNPNHNYNRRDYNR